MVSLIQIVILSIIQGAAELLPVSSSAHVIVAEKLMGLDPSAPEMTFLLVMLHTGTMFAVLLYFWPRWKKLKLDFYKLVLIATAVTGVLGLGLKKLIEKVILVRLLGETNGEIEMLFKSLPLVAAALFAVGVLIVVAGMQETKKVKSGSKAGPKSSSKAPSMAHLNTRSSIMIGFVQGLCLPFRGFSRSGATISAALLTGINRSIAEDFSFALAVVLTPPVIVLELYRLLHASHAADPVFFDMGRLLAPGLMGMVFSFGAGFVALKWLSAWLEKGRWKFFGFYCIFASLVVFALQLSGL